MPWYKWGDQATEGPIPAKRLSFRVDTKFRPCWAGKSYHWRHKPNDKLRHCQFAFQYPCAHQWIKFVGYLRPICKDHNWKFNNVMLWYGLMFHIFLCLQLVSWEFQQFPDFLKKCLELIWVFNSHLSPPNSCRLLPVRYTQRIHAVISQRQFVQALGGEKTGHKIEIWMSNGFAGGWTNPIWKIWSSNWIISPSRDEHKKISETTNQLLVHTFKSTSRRDHSSCLVHCGFKNIMPRFHKTHECCKARNKWHSTFQSPCLSSPAKS